MFPFMLYLNSVRFKARIQIFILFILTTLFVFQQTISAATDEVVHAGISPQTIPNANINDALAAIKAWISDTAKERGVKATFKLNIIKSPSQMRDGLENQQLDIVNTSTDNVLHLDLSNDTIFAGLPEDSSQPRYVLVAHRDSAINHVKELKHAKVTIPHGDFMQLAEIWFETVLQEQVQSTMASYLGQITKSENFCKAGMQVFFKQIDAAVMTKKALENLCAHNPQLEEDLTVISESIPLLPVILIIRASWQSPLRQDIEEILSELHTKPRGKKVLEVFHCSHLEKQPITALKPTLSMLRKYNAAQQKSEEQK